MLIMLWVIRAVVHYHAMGHNDTVAHAIVHDHAVGHMMHVVVHDHMPFCPTVTVAKNSDMSHGSLSL